MVQTAVLRYLAAGCKFICRNELRWIASLVDSESVHHGAASGGAGTIGLGMSLTLISMRPGNLQVSDLREGKI
jgi:hypothetical protein